jgi:crossover junction endodeoxyribonuclease RuvC
VLGIDPGSIVTGYALVQQSGNQCSCPCSGQIALGAGDLTARLTRLFRELSGIVERHRPDCVAVESAFHAKSVRSALVLGHARGVILLAAGMHGVPVAEYSPREVKLSVVGRGAATKDQVQFMVRRLLPLDRAPRADEADAMALGLCHLHRARLHLPRSRSRAGRPAAEAALWRAKAPRSTAAPAPAARLAAARTRPKERP